ncbi:MAG: alcohol dehydrogenase catalytic domain-containing protein [Myxococcales bacterium]|nr:alcohol dehydrogenase catalytic domain-containing protein [Myxococcales bacterium]
MSTDGPTRLSLPSNHPAASGELTEVAETDVVVEICAYDVSATASAEARAACGVVIATGKVAGEWLGKSVLVPALFPCGECETCRRGGVFVCAARSSLAVHAAGLPRHLRVAGRWLTPLPAACELRPELARLGGEALHAYTMYAYGNVGPRDICVVLGDAPLAWWLCRVLASKGAHVATIYAGTAKASAPTTTWSHIACDDDRQPLSPRVQRELAALAQAADAGAQPWRLFVADPHYFAVAAALANPLATIVSVAKRAAAPTLCVGDLMEACASLVFIADGHPDLLPDVLGLALSDGWM